MKEKRAKIIMGDEENVPVGFMSSMSEVNDCLKLVFAEVPVFS